MLAASACASPPEPPPAEVAPTPAVAPAPEPPSSGRPRIVFLGDSLTAGYTLEEAEAFPARTAELLAAAGQAVDVVNAGVSGDTSAGGLRRLAWLLRQKPDLLVVELGANDGLRGLPLTATEENLSRIVEQAQDSGAEVLLLGMQIPPNYGPEYSQGFAQIFPRLAQEKGVELVPFLLEGVAGNPELNLPDGIHPTPEGHAIVAKTLLPYLERALSRLPSEPQPSQTAVTMEK